MPEGMKVCPMCKEDLPFSSYYWNYTRNSPASRCKTCQKVYAKEHYRKKQDEKGIVPRGSSLDRTDDGKKVCKKCSEAKDPSEFYKHHRYSDGLSLWCKECSKQYATEWKKARKVEKVEDALIGRKTCGWCEESLPLEAFYAASLDKDNAACRECTRTGTKRLPTVDELNKIGRSEPGDWLRGRFHRPDGS